MSPYVEAFEKNYIISPFSTFDVWRCLWTGMGQVPSLVSESCWVGHGGDQRGAHKILVGNPEGRIPIVGHRQDVWLILTL
jgi:hypothetical protein